MSRRCWGRRQGRVSTTTGPTTMARNATMLTNAKAASLMTGPYSVVPQLDTLTRPPSQRGDRLGRAQVGFRRVWPDRSRRGSWRILVAPGCDVIGGAAPPIGSRGQTV